MEEVVINGNEKAYEPASPIRDRALWEKVLSMLKVMFVILVTFLRCIPIGIILLKNIIIPRRRKNIRGQVALVTGGANGLGREICLSLAKQGCNLAVADLDLRNAEQTAADCRQHFNVLAVPYKLDVTNHRAVKATRLKIEQDLGPVDILVNNAGLVALFSLREGTTSDIQRIINVNLVSHFWTTREFLDGMIERKRGHIVAISSLSGLLPMAHAICYSATKHGVRGMMEGFYDELCLLKLQKMVRTTTVYPYFINTTRAITDLATTFNMDRIQALQPSDVSETIVQAIQQNNRSLTIPRKLSGIVSLIGFLPIEMQQMIKTYFFTSDTVK